MPVDAAQIAAAGHGPRAPAVGAGGAVDAGSAPPAAPGLLVGYAGIVGSGPELEEQVRVLAGVGCVRVYGDRPTAGAGPAAGRPELVACLAGLAVGDTFIVASLDRLAPSVPDLIAVVTQLQRRGVAFRSLAEGLGAATPGGRLAAAVFIPLAEFIRDLLEEEIPAGTDAGQVDQLDQLAGPGAGAVTGESGSARISVPVSAPVPPAAS